MFIKMFYMMNISLSYYPQPLQQLVPDQDFWMTAPGREQLLATPGFWANLVPYMNSSSLQATR